MNELVAIESLNPIQAFSNGGLDTVLERIEKEARAIHIDISTEKGRKDCASLAYKIAQSKTALDKIGKDLVAGWKEQSKKVDVERAKAWDRLEALQKEVRSPLTEWENKEKDRVAAHEAALVEIEQLTIIPDDANVAELEKRIARCIEISSRSWEEFASRGKLAHDQAYGILVKKVEARSKYDAEQAELARLRKEAAEREQKEREERIAAEAAAKAKGEAEAAARREAERAEQERVRIEREKEQAEARAKKAEAEKIAAEEKAKADAIAAAEKAKRDAELAAQRERERIENERRVEAEAAAKREADKQHRAKINNDALYALNEIIEAFQKTGNNPAKAIIEAIARGNIPHVKIVY